MLNFHYDQNVKSYELALQLAGDLIGGDVGL